MTGVELLILFAVILLVTAVSLFFKNRSKIDQLEMRTRANKWEYREVNGQKVAIEADDPNQADVIAETWRTGKPVYGTYDDDGNFVMKVLNGED